MNKKVTITLISLFIITVFASVFFLYSKSWANEKTQSEQTNLSQKEIEEYLKQIDNYTFKDKNYNEAILLAEELVKRAPQDVRGYVNLRFLFTIIEKYRDAIDMGEKVIEIRKKKNLSICGDIIPQAMAYEYNGEQKKAIDYLEGYRTECPTTIEEPIFCLQESILSNSRCFPPLQK